MWDNEGPVRRIAALQRVESIRSLRTGQRIHITGSPVAALNLTPGGADHAGLNVLATSHYGINNLPKQAQDSIAQLLGQAHKLLAGMLSDLQPCASPVQAIGVHLGAKQAGSPSIHYLSSYGIDSEPAVTSTACAPLHLDHSAALAQAQAIGYANVCELLEGQVPWRCSVQSPETRINTSSPSGHWQ